MNSYTKKNWELSIDEEFANKYQAGKKTHRFQIKSIDFYANELLIATIWAEDEFVTLQHKTPSQVEQDANAHLMNAAPDLLEACEIRLASIKRLYGKETAEKTLEYAAIAKAKKK